MSGIDGWETIRRIRVEQLSDAPIPIVSANAFEKGTDDYIGIPTEDFILQPVRKSESVRLAGPCALLAMDRGAAAPSPAGQPSAERLQEMIDLGDFRRIVKQLDDIADILGMSPAAVRKHLEHVYEKLGLETRTTAEGLAMIRVRLNARQPSALTGSTADLTAQAVSTLDGFEP